MEMHELNTDCNTEMNLGPAPLPIDEEHPDGRFKIFRARHITMMALGTLDVGLCN
jgi:hypothetical protein